MNTKEKYTKEELKYLMNFNEIERIPINYHNSFVGYVKKDLSYERGPLHYMTLSSYAIELACEQFDSYMESVKKFRSDDVITAEVIYHNVHDEWEYADDDGVVRHHVYPISVDTTKAETWTGTYDQLMEKMYRANNHLRYCNGMSYAFAESNMKSLYCTWNKYISKSRSFDLYYGGGVVD